MNNIWSHILVAFLASGFTGLINIYINRDQANRIRLQQKTIDLVALVRETEKIGCEYWLLEGDRDKILALEVQIRSGCMKIGRMIGSMDREFSIFRFDGWKYLTAFRQHITSAPFEQIGRPSDRYRHYEIIVAANNLESVIEEAARRRTFPNF